MIYAGCGRFPGVFAGPGRSSVCRSSAGASSAGGKTEQETKRGLYLRKSALFLSACAVLVFTALARGQETDLAVSASTLFSTKLNSASLVYSPPPEKAGLYPGVSVTHTFADLFGFKNRLGFNIELSALARRGLYNGFQGYRPVLYDFNAVYQTHVEKKTAIDLMAGFGGERLLFYHQIGGCVSPNGCQFMYNANHFLIDAGGDVRYTFWKHFFVRPEAHYYRIVDNNEFHSGNVVRLGASIGYTFGAQ
jgi:hypothetical protein